MSKSETSRHVTARSSENVGPFGLFDSAKVTKVYDKATGNQGVGYGRDRQEADQRAKDDLWSKNQK